MELINKEEEKKIIGGAVKIGVISIIGTAISFLIGVLEGLVNPQKCNK